MSDDGLKARLTEAQKDNAAMSAAVVALEQALTDAKARLEEAEAERDAARAILSHLHGDVADAGNICPDDDKGLIGAVQEIVRQRDEARAELQAEREQFNLMRAVAAQNKGWAEKAEADLRAAREQLATCYSQSQMDALYERAEQSEARTGELGRALLRFKGRHTPQCIVRRCLRDDPNYCGCSSAKDDEVIDRALASAPARDDNSEPAKPATGDDDKELCLCGHAKCFHDDPPNCSALGGVHGKPYCICPYYRAANKDDPPPAPSSERNQCDGCAMGLRVIDGKHWRDGSPFMVCQQERYAPPPEPVKANHAIDCNDNDCEGCIAFVTVKKPEPGAAGERCEAKEQVCNDHPEPGCCVAAYSFERQAEAWMHRCEIAEHELEVLKSKPAPPSPASEMREQCARVAAPYHKGLDGRGCRHFCTACRERRNIQDAIRALPAPAPSPDAIEVAREALALVRERYGNMRDPDHGHGYALITTTCCLESFKEGEPERHEEDCWRPKVDAALAQLAAGARKP